MPICLQRINMKNNHPLLQKMHKIGRALPNNRSRALESIYNHALRKNTVLPSWNSGCATVPAIACDVSPRQKPMIRK